MRISRRTDGTSSRAARPWVVFGVVAGLALAAGLATALAVGDGIDVVVALVGGLVLIGLTALLLLPVLSPRPNQLVRRRLPPIKGLGLEAPMDGSRPYKQ